MQPLKIYFIGFASGVVFTIVCKIIARAISRQTERTDDIEQRIADNAGRTEQSISEAVDGIATAERRLDAIAETTNRSKELNTRARELANASARILKETRQLLEDCKGRLSNSDSD